MKLSEAIRLGAMLKPQGTGEYFHDGKTCAIGAAADALGWLGVVDKEGMAPLRDEWPILTMTPLHQEPSFQRWSVEEIIMFANDVRGWSRERIADYVEQIERAQEAPHPAAQLVTAD